MKQLEFEIGYRYASQAEGIALPTVLRCGDEVTELIASVDTGSANCMFQRVHAEILGLDVERGYPKVFATATGRIEAFGHMIEIEVLGLKTETMAYFFGDERIRKNLLGRSGWLDRIRFGLVEYEQLVYLGKNDV